MTSKEQIKTRIHSSLQNPAAKEGKDIFANALIQRFVDGITEEQAAAILSVDKMIDSYTDGTQSPPFDLGWTLWMLLSIAAAEHNDGKFPSVEDVKAIAQGINNRSYPTEASSFWMELVKSLESAGAPEPSIEAFRSIVPKSYIMPVNKLQKNIPTIAEFEDAEATITVIPENKKRDAITTRIELSFDAPNMQITGRSKPTAFDLAIQNGIISLIVSGNEVITPAMAYRATTGMTETQYISPQQVAAATKSIEKQRSTRIKIDATEEAKAYNKELQEFTFDGFLIAADRATVTLNGAKHTAYIFGHDRSGKVQPPILYRYAQISQQIQNVPAEALRLPINNTERNIVLRDYLLREIGAMRNAKAKRRPEITYNGIYDHLGIDQESSSAKVETKRTRDAAEKILSHWKRTGYIKDFSTYKKGRAIAGVKITP